MYFLMDFAKTKRAQMALEYAVLIACIVAAFFAIQVYSRRSIAGRLKEAADNIASAGQQSAFGGISSFYEPTKTRTEGGGIISALERTVNTTVEQPLREKKEGYPLMRSTVTSEQTITRQGKEMIE